jgi:hypothetical protein
MKGTFHNIRFTEEEDLKLQELMKKYKYGKVSTLIKRIIFNKEIHVVTHDKSLYDVIEVVTDLLYQYKKVGVNYNQSVKYMQRVYGEKAAKEFLKGLVQNTAELIGITEKIVPIVDGLKKKYLYETQQKAIGGSNSNGSQD